MPVTYIPAILNQAILPDGEAAQILEFLNSASPPAAILPATNSVAKSYRKGHMRLSFLLQFSDLADADAASLTLVLRSPFPDDDGDQTNRPAVFITPASTAGLDVFAFLPGGIPGATPPVTAVDWAATFNGKPIPNWTVGLSHSEGAEGSAGVWVHVLWGHTVGN